MTSPSSKAFAGLVLQSVAYGFVFWTLSAGRAEGQPSLQCRPVASIVMPRLGSLPTVVGDWKFPEGEEPPSGAAVTVRVLEYGSDPAARLGRINPPEVSAQWSLSQGLTLTVHRGNVRLGEPRALLFSWDVADSTVERCFVTHFIADPPTYIRTEWMVGGTAVNILDATAPPNPAVPHALRFTGTGLWRNVTLELGEPLASTVMLGGRTFSAGANEDQLLVNLSFHPGDIPAGLHRAQLKIARTGWSHDVLALPIRVSGPRPSVTEILPAEIKSGASILDLTIKGSRFADPVVDLNYRASPDATASPLAQSVRPAEHSPGCNPQTCIRAVADVRPLPNSGFVEVVVKNFDGKEGVAQRVPLSLRTYDFPRVQALHADGSWVRAGQRSDVVISDPAAAQAGAIKSVRLDGKDVTNDVSVSDQQRVVTITGLVFAHQSPGPGREALIEVLREGGYRGVGKLTVYADPEDLSPIAAIAVPGKAQAIRLRGRHLAGLALVSGKDVTVHSSAADGPDIVAVITPLGAGPGTVLLQRQGVSVAEPSVSFHPNPGLASIVRFSAGAPDCGAPRNELLTSPLKVPAGGRVCLSIEPLKLADLSASVRDTVVVTVKQGNSIVGTTPPRDYRSVEGTGVAPIEVPMTGIEAGQDFVIIVRRGAGEPATQSAAMALARPLGGFAALSVSTLALGSVTENIHERRVSTAATPQLGLWIAPNTYSTNHRFFVSLLTSKLQYCEGSSKDILSLGMGWFAFRILTLGLGTPVENERVPTNCPGTAANNAENSAPLTEIAAKPFKRWFLMVGVAAP